MIDIYYLSLKQIERGDYVALLDCGGNSIALSNRHCSRFSPRVYGKSLHETIYRPTPYGSLQYGRMVLVGTRDILVKCSENLQWLLKVYVNLENSHISYETR